jgi:glycine hydroxymethyltransferase
MILSRAEHAEAIDKAVFPATQGGPLMHVVAAKAVALKEAASPDFEAYAAQVVSNAAALAKGLEIEGMRPVSGGTDTHLALLDLTGLGISGAVAERRCDAAAITLNKNTIPFDANPPITPSGIRVGSACVTTQGMAEPEMAGIARLIGRAVRTDDAAELTEIGAAASRLVAERPAYPRG